MSLWWPAAGESGCEKLSIFQIRKPKLVVEEWRLAQCHRATESWGFPAEVGLEGSPSRMPIFKMEKLRSS